MTATIRPATEADASAIAEIYAPFCESSPISFELAAPPPEEMARRIRAVTGQFPWLVLDDAQTIAGYAYASRHRERAAYIWSADAAVYIHPAYRRCGVGRALYTALFHVLRLQGYFNVYAGITLPNPASVGLHEALGFALVGVYRGVGFKQGAWHDVAWYQLDLQSERLTPAPLLPVASIIDSRDWLPAMRAGLEHYRGVPGEPTVG